jgi:alpha-L-rhamnosidase
MGEPTSLVATRAADDDSAVSGFAADSPALTGTWIEPVPVPESSRRPQRLRRVVVLEHPVVAARLRIASRGDAAVFVNDVRLDGEGPSPGPDGSPVVREYDAAAALRMGENVVAVILGESWGSAAPVPGVRPFPAPAPPLAVLLDLECTEERGGSLRIGSDELFRATTGAIVFSEPGRGERQEHALRDPGWKLSGFDDSGWTPVRRSADQSVHELVAAQPDDSPVRVVAEVSPVAVEPLPGGGVLLDVGRRLVGRVRVRFSAPAGTEVVLQHLVVRPELTVPDAPVATDEFVSAGDAEEVFEPGYAFHDFRFVRVTGLPDPLSARFTVLELSLDVDGRRTAPEGGDRERDPR